MLDYVSKKQGENNMLSSQKVQESPKIGPSDRSFIGRLFTRGLMKKKKDGASNRRHERYECANAGRVSIVNSSLSLDGIITEIAKGGVKFRPFQSYLLERNGKEVTVEILGQFLTGKIAATRVDGYGIALFEQLSDEKINMLINTNKEVLSQAN